MRPIKELLIIMRDNLPLAGDDSFGSLLILTMELESLGLINSEEENVLDKWVEENLPPSIEELLNEQIDNL